MVESDTSRLAYDPSAPVPPLRDLNPRGYGGSGMRELVQGVLESGLPHYLNAAIATPDEMPWTYARYGVTYQVEVVFPEETGYWTYHFDRDLRYRLEIGPSESEPDVRLRITASALAKISSWNFLLVSALFSQMTTCSTLSN